MYMLLLASYLLSVLFWAAFEVGVTAMIADVQKRDSSGRIQSLQKELDALNVDHVKIKAKLKSKQTRST